MIGRSIDMAVDVLHRGGVIGYPTETVYGLGGDPESDEAVDRISRLKTRDPEKAFLMLVPSFEMVHDWVQSISYNARRLMEAFWPGPLTLIFSARHDRTAVLGASTVGFRLSPDPVCRRLMKQWQRPLISTSANPTGEEPAKHALMVETYFGKTVDYVLDGGERSSASVSTIVDVSIDPPRLIRKGEIPKISIENVIGVVHV